MKETNSRFDLKRGLLSIIALSIITFIGIMNFFDLVEYDKTVALALFIVAALIVVTEFFFGNTEKENNKEL